MPGDLKDGSAHQENGSGETQPNPTKHPTSTSRSCFLPLWHLSLCLTHTILVRLIPRVLPIPFCLPHLLYLIGTLLVSRDQFSDASHMCSTSRLNSCWSHIWFCGSTDYFSTMKPRSSHDWWLTITVESWRGGVPKFSHPRIRKRNYAFT